MANHPNRSKNQYELTFWGGPAGIRYQRMHPTFEAAKDVAHKVLAEMSNRNAHPAIIYGPDLGRDGVTVG